MAQKKAAAAKPREPLTDAQLLAEATRFASSKLLAKQVKAIITGAEERILGEMDARGVTTLQLGATTFTRAQRIERRLDVMGLFNALAAKVRGKLFRKRESLDALPEARRTELIASLGVRERKAITTYDVDEPALEAAMEAREVDARTVALFTTEAPQKPYLVVTGAPEPAKKA